jgi:hypothetical protein
VIKGGTGIDVTKTNGAATVDLDYSEFGAISAIPTSPTSYILTYDTLTLSYVLLPSHLLGGAVAGIADAPADGKIYGRQSATWVPSGDFIQAGSGAVTRSMQNKAREIFSILDFGGVGNGVFDNTAAFNAALAALPSGGGGIYFPPGKYCCNSAISFNLPAGSFSLGLFGAGQDISILFFPSGHGGITINYSNASHSVHVRDMSITTGIADGGTGLILNAASIAPQGVSDIYRVTLRGDDGYNVNAWWTAGVSIQGAVSNVNVEGLMVSGVGTANGLGVNIVGLAASSKYAVQINIAKSVFESLANGIVYNGWVQGVTVDQTNFTVIKTGIASFAGTPAQEGVLAQLAVTNSQFGFITDGIITGTPILSTQITNCLFIIEAANTAGVFLSGSNHFNITGCSFGAENSSGTYGIIIGPTGAGAITGNDIAGFGTAIALQTGVQGVNVQGNTLEGNIVNVEDDAGPSHNNVFANNVGYNPLGPASISIGPSPFIYTAGTAPETVYVWGGAVSAISYDKNGGPLAAVANNASPCTIQLGPNEQMKVTYSAAPFMNKMVH